MRDNRSLPRLSVQCYCDGRGSRVQQALFLFSAWGKVTADKTFRRHQHCAQATRKNAILCIALGILHLSLLSPICFTSRVTLSRIGPECCSTAIKPQLFQLTSCDEQLLQDEHCSIQAPGQLAKEQVQQPKVSLLVNTHLQTRALISAKRPRCQAQVTSTSCCPPLWERGGSYLRQ